MSAFIYITDFHTSHNLNLKNQKYQDFIGLQVTETGISPMTQSNTFYPQMSIYNAGLQGSQSDRLAVSAILNYISGFKKPEGLTDKYGLESNGRPDCVLAEITPPTHNPGINQLVMDSYGKFKVRSKK